jgi:hypothetical protein
MSNDPTAALAWTRKLQERYPEKSVAIDEIRLLEMVRESLGTCEGLKISDEEDVLRYIALRVLLTAEQRESRLIRGVVIRTLSYVDWESGKRLDFIYKHIVGRRVAQNETDFGPLFVPEVKQGG